MSRQLSLVRHFLLEFEFIVFTLQLYLGHFASLHPPQYLFLPMTLTLRYIDTVQNAINNLFVV